MPFLAVQHLLTEELFLPGPWKEGPDHFTAGLEMLHHSVQGQATMGLLFKYHEYPGHLFLISGHHSHPGLLGPRTRGTQSTHTWPRISPTLGILSTHLTPLLIRLSTPQAVSWGCQDRVTAWCTWTLNNRNVFCYSSVGPKPKMEAWSGVASSEG